jgi:hypothetical protein
MYTWGECMARWLARLLPLPTVMGPTGAEGAASEEDSDDEARSLHHLVLRSRHLDVAPGRDRWAKPV